MEPGSLSARGRGLIATGPVPEYFAAHFERVEDRWTPHDRDGYISLCIAENKLVWDLLGPRLAAASETVPAAAVEYDHMVGSTRFRKRLARFIGEKVAGRDLDPDQIVVLAGAGSVLEMLFYAICDRGDGVLVPTPSYSGFWADLETRDELQIVPVHTRSEDGFRLTADLLDRAADEAGVPIKALLFTNPDNPTGRVHGRTDLEAIVKWADARGVHLVLDEVFALSTFGGEFVSGASVVPSLGERIHLVWALSKDFAVSGMRCGVLVSENPKVVEAVAALAYWAVCSGHTQHILGALLADEEWSEAFLGENRRRLGEAYRRVTAALDDAGIPHLPAQAGFFLICDMRPFMEEITWEEEGRLWRRLLDEARVNLTPGSACRIGEPGFMRVCYSGVPTEAAVEGIGRVARVLEKHG